MHGKTEIQLCMLQRNMNEGVCISNANLKELICFILSEVHVKLLPRGSHILRCDGECITFLDMLRKVTKKQFGKVPNVTYGMRINGIRTVLRTQTDKVKMIQISMGVLRHITKFKILAMEMSSVRMPNLY